MMQIWFLFKVIETVIGLACMLYHILGFVNPEPLPHIMLFCGTFFGFTVVTLVGAIAILVGSAPPVFVECIVNFFAAVLYILASIMSMYYAENDFHLMYLSDFEEPSHPFFAFCRSQSICALAAGSVHLLHALLATDALLSKKSGTMSASEDSSSDSDTESHDIDLKRPIRMYFLSKFIEKRLRRYKWFNNMCKQNESAVSLFTLRKFKGSREKIEEHNNATDGNELLTSQTKKKVKTSQKQVLAEPAPLHDVTDSEEKLEKDSKVTHFSSTDDPSSFKTVNEKDKASETASSESTPKARFNLPTEQSKEARRNPILRKSDQQSQSTAEDKPVEENSTLSNSKITERRDDPTNNDDENKQPSNSEDENKQPSNSEDNQENDDAKAKKEDPNRKPPPTAPPSD